jgi:hypothetical protein
MAEDVEYDLLGGASILVGTQNPSLQLKFRRRGSGMDLKVEEMRQNDEDRGWTEWWLDE